MSARSDYYSPLTLSRYIPIISGLGRTSILMKLESVSTPLFTTNFTRYVPGFTNMVVASFRIEVLPLPKSQLLGTAGSASTRVKETERGSGPARLSALKVAFTLPDAMAKQIRRKDITEVKVVFIIKQDFIL